jgi:hypothetical protein
VKLRQESQRITIVDALPTVFGIIGIAAGTISAGHSSYVAISKTLATVSWLLTFALALMSLASVTRRTSAPKYLFIINMLWVLLVLGSFLWFIYELGQAF